MSMALLNEDRTFHVKQQESRLYTFIKAALVMICGMDGWVRLLRLMQ